MGMEESKQNQIPESINESSSEEAESSDYDSSKEN